MYKEKKPVPFQQVVDALLDDTKPFPARFIYRFSDLSPDELSLLKQNWGQVPLRRRQAVMEDVEEFNSDFVLNFYDIAMLAVQDPDALVRLLAIHTLAEYDDAELVDVFIQLAEHDQEAPVRAAAANALGHFVQLGELEELPKPYLKRVENCLLRICTGEDEKIVRRRALEGLGYSSRDEVNSLIKTAYRSEDTDWLISSLVAMGRSYNPDWRDDVMAALMDSRADVRVEAITAAGELELKEALRPLMKALKEKDPEIRYAAIWALSQIGGEEVRPALERLLRRATDDEEEELLEAALENLAFTEDMEKFLMLDFDEEDLNNLNDLDEEDFEEEE